MEQTWLANLTSKAMRICRLTKEAVGNTRQDMTGPILSDLLNNGYNQVTWNSNGSTHSTCLNLDRQTWGLRDFLNTTEYDAPLFSRSHPGDQSCTLTVSGPDLPVVDVDSYGDVDTAIGTRRPAQTQTPIQKQPVIRTIKPPEPKHENTPVKPEQRTKRVTPKEFDEIPESVPEPHKQDKDPFEKQQLSEQEYLERLKELEQEQVQESIPQVDKELSYDELDEIKNFNKETSKKLPNWITGIFKDN